MMNKSFVSSLVSKSTIRQGVVRDRSAAAVRYYVDATGGSDSNNGLSESAAWQTIAKVNAATIKPGESVLFKRGQTWAGTRLTVPSSGSAGAPITFGAYGSGANPRINKNNDYGIYATGKSFLVFQNIDGNDSKRNYYFLNCHDVAVISCALTGTFTDESSILFEGSSDNASYNFYVDSCTFSGTPGWGISGNANQGSNLQITNCTFTNIGSAGAVQHHALYLTNWSGMLIRNCVIDAPYNSGIKLVQSSGKVVSGVIEKCKITNCARSTVTGPDIQLDGVTGDLTIRNCHLADNLKSEGIVALNHVSNNLKVYANTIVRHYRGIGLYAATTGWIVKNNLIVQDMAWINNNLRCCVNVDAEGDLANNTFENNLYWFKSGAGSENPLRTNTGTKTLAQWRALTGTPDLLSVSAAPVFVTDYTNLHLQSSSPARNIGADLGIADDYDGVARVAPPDVGAYEFV
jgi:hypothetical protein